jgi:hypothetical protein
MRRTFCDRCDAPIKDLTVANRIELPDHTSVDLCDDCVGSLRELVRKWKTTLGAHANQ